MSGNNIKVVCRFRPQNKLEIKEGGVPIVDISEDGTGVAVKVTYLLFWESGTPNKQIALFSSYK